VVAAGERSVPTEETEAAEDEVTAVGRMLKLQRKAPLNITMFHDHHLPDENNVSRLHLNRWDRSPKA
jgi:hypothetical protein